MNKTNTHRGDGKKTTYSYIYIYINEYKTSAMISEIPKQCFDLQTPSNLLNLSLIDIHEYEFYLELDFDKYNKM